MKTLADMTIPMTIGFLGMVAFNLVDMFFVGRLGSSELAALSFTFPVVMIIGSLALGVGVGVSAVTSTAIGRGDHHQVQELATDSLILAVIMGLVFEWLEDEIGGVSVIEQLNRKKARILYDYIDNSEFYKSPVKNENRSLMNIPFTLADNELNDKFIAEANNEGLTSLKGHRSVGGMRASIYNAMPLQGVEKLVDFMKYFEENNG